MACHINHALNAPRGWKYSKLNQSKIESVISRAQDAFLGKWKESYLKRLSFVDNDNTLTQDEKDEAKLNLTILKDRDNLLNRKGETYRCDTCDKLGYMIIWCHHCVADFLRDNASKWTSGNEYIDRQIYLAQMRGPIPEAIPEWIPYELLTNVSYLTQGGCASIYSATYNRGLYTRWEKATRTLSRGLIGFKVVLKKLNLNNEEVNLRDELEKHLYVSSVYDAIVRCYGVTRDPITKDYMLVLNKMRYDLRLVHRDLHPGNILRGRIDNNWYIADLGFTGHPNKAANQIIGNPRYIAPEIYTKREYSIKSDIYAFGMLLYYMITFKQPFAGLLHDDTLNLEVFIGTRPIIPDRIPKAYSSLMRRCWDVDPNKRPSTVKISKVLLLIASRIKQQDFVLQNAPSEADSEISQNVHEEMDSGISTVNSGYVIELISKDGTCAINFADKQHCLVLQNAPAETDSETLTENNENVIKLISNHDSCAISFADKQHGLVLQDVPAELDSEISLNTSVEVDSVNLTYKGDTNY
ncbi:11699_t:CDS:2 [Scutellospora calospora]|uniref:11699_t:CDS:1 n=1 Tax=Scutellospora calospora TaxID=85575 RepID=A0ACA9KRH0_9GLOM|nr:11699_t:CDS:2 [Scutellospora calospora]